MAPSAMERLIAKVARTDPTLALKVYLIARPRQRETRRTTQTKFVICEQTIDITYVRTDAGWLYLATILDASSRRVVGWSLADHLRTELALDALTMALTTRRPAPGLIHHADRGTQYLSSAYADRLAAHHLRQSVGHPGTCWDNAVAESFFATLKTELLHRQTWATRQQARTAIFEYIEVFYNRQRRHSTLGYLSPADFEDRYHRQASAA